MAIAPTLRELQAAFSQSLFTHEPQGLEPWVDSHGLATCHRIQIYRNMVFNTFTDVLKTSYPSVLRLIGSDCFDGLAARYIAQVPSVSGNLQDYGRAFPEFLATTAETAMLPYLPDVARLEWLRQEVYLAPDAKPAAMEWLVLLTEDELAKSMIELHPSIRLLNSQFPVVDIWRFCQDSAPQQLHLDDGGQTALAWRSEHQIAILAVAPEVHRFVTELLADRALEDAIHAALATAPEFNLASTLQLLLQHGLVVDAHIPGRRKR